MFDLRPGVFGVTKNLEVKADGSTLKFSAKRNKEFIVLLVGVQDKKLNDTPDADEFISLMATIGFAGSSDLKEALGEKQVSKLTAFMCKKYPEVIE